ncbi:unnamed protein product [Alternaria alternata]
MSSEPTEQEIYHADRDAPKRVSMFTRWYRSPLFNVIVVGMISFTQPGIWNALNNVGAGGQQEPYLVNGANSLTFGIMVFGCSLFAILANKFGLKNILLLGTLGYAPYSASLYVNNRYGVEWFVLLGGATCGIAASALWASEGAIALGYADVHNRGKFTGIWLGLRELGQLIGSSIQLSLNYKSGQRGKVGYTTYIVLIALQCLGLPLALLVSPPHKVYHRDGRKVPDPTKNKAVLKEVQRWWALLRDRRFFLLVPVMIGFNWNNTYQGIYLTKYFSVRARTLGSLTSGVAATFANIFWGWFYDTKFVSRPTLAKVTWGIFSLLMLGLFGWQVANEKMYAGSKVTLDWDLPGFGRGFAVNVLFRFMNESHYMFVYWILGAFFDDIETLTLAVGLLRSFESVGSCLAFGIGAAKIEPMANLIVAFVIIAATYPDLIDVDDQDYPAPSTHQNPPPVPPKIPEVPVEQAEPKVEMSKLTPSHCWIPVPARSKEDPARYTKPFTDYMTRNPTIFHAVDAVAQDLEKDGYKKLSERDSWELKAGGKYYVERNGSSLIAFAIGDKYASGNGASILAGHIDALTAKLKPISKLRNKSGYVQLGVAPYAGALSDTWWDRDLGIGGRVLVKENGKIVTKLVKLDWPIARIPTLAPHFGAAANGPFNKETQMVPIMGLDNSDIGSSSNNEEGDSKAGVLGGEGAFTATQPERLVKVITSELGITDYSSIVNWELELFDTQPAQTGGLDREFIFAGRIDDKLCSWAAIQALLNSSASLSTSSQIRMVAVFDDEEVGSLLRQGAHGNFLPSVMERIVEEFASNGKTSSALSRTYANSFLVSSDVIHAVNPNFLNAYLENHSPRLNVGPAISADSNAHMTTDAVSTAILQRCVDRDIGVRKVDPKLQVFQIRNDSRSGGTVGPMLSSATGIRAVDCGIPQLSMHSIRATTGSLDPGLGVFAFQSFLENFESVDKEFRE